MVSVFEEKLLESCCFDSCLKYLVGVNIWSTLTSKVNKSKVCRKQNLEIKSMSLSSSSGNMLKCKVDGSRFAKDEVGIE